MEHCHYYIIGPYKFSHLLFLFIVYSFIYSFIPFIYISIFTPFISTCPLFVGSRILFGDPVCSEK